MDGEGHLVKWEFVAKLHELQTQEGLHLANKLKKKHLDYVKNKMKVSLASQVLSQSVATAIEFCRETLEMENFVGSEATVEFLRTFDLLFDVMNSKYTFGKFSKAPLKISNQQEWENTLTRCERYINGLCHANGQSMFTGRRRAAFIEWTNIIKVHLF